MEEKIKVIEILKMGIEIYNEEVLDKNYGIINNWIICDYNGEIFRVISVFYYLNIECDVEKFLLVGWIVVGIVYEVWNFFIIVWGYL